MKKFSIVTPVFKDSYKYLGACYWQIKDQNYDNWEWIIVLDGPNKPALDALEKGFDLERTGRKTKIKPLSDKRVKVVTCAHGGAPRARNYGVNKSDGDYITLIDPDVYLFPGTLREWADELEKTECGFVFGSYEIIGGYQIPAQEFSRKVLETNNYISGANPIKREFWIPQDESLPSLQDWDMWLTVTKNTCGKFIDKSFFITEAPGNISKYSTTHWIELTNKIRNKHGIPKSKLAVISLGAEHHAINAAKTLCADVPNRTLHKPHEYKAIYLMGFYPNAVREHLFVFQDVAETDKQKQYIPNKAKKIIHWIGTDVLQMHKSLSYDALKSLKSMFKNMKIVHLTECQQTHDELKEIGIDSKIVPTVPSKLFKYNEFPQPKKFTVANYINPTQREIYQEKLMTDVAKSMPDVQFLFFGDKTKTGVDGNIIYGGWMPIEDVIKKSSCIIRMVQHDGLPHSPLQFMTAGRRVISNYKFKYFDNAQVDNKSIIEAIREVQKNPTVDEKASDYWRKELDHDKYKKEIWKIVNSQ